MANDDLQQGAHSNFLFTGHQHKSVRTAIFAGSKPISSGPKPYWNNKNVTGKKVNAKKICSPGAPCRAADKTCRWQQVFVKLARDFNDGKVQTRIEKNTWYSISFR
jgi:hypothetical protein